MLANIVVHALGIRHQLTVPLPALHLLTWPLLQATFEDSLAEEAVAKKHCTTSEAVQVGAQAAAYRTLLTHFSQRYPKIPVVDQNFQVGWARCVAEKKNRSGEHLGG